MNYSKKQNKMTENKNLISSKIFLKPKNKYVNKKKIFKVSRRERLQIFSKLFFLFIKKLNKSKKTRNDSFLL